MSFKYNKLSFNYSKKSFQIYFIIQNIILISNLTILNIFIQTYIFILTRSKYNPRLLISNGSMQNSLKWPKQIEINQLLIFKFRFYQFHVGELG